ncbi:MAG: 50S ribosomal protein L21 [Pseudomonadota bacterium]
MYAVVKTGGKQYRVSENDTLKVERLAGDAGDIVTLDDVLIVGEGADVTVGAPKVEGASVAAEIVEQARDRKVLIFKKRRRQNYRRRRGHRQHYTLLKITEILTDGAKPSKKKAAPKKAKPAPKASEAEGKETKASAPKAAAPAGDGDDLKKLSGVGPVLETKLKEAGVTTFAQIASWGPEEIEEFDEKLSFKGRIEREGWVEQAKTLAKGDKE